MRALFLIALGITVAALPGCASPSAPAPPSTASPPSATPTKPTGQVVLRPVTESGRPARGFSVTSDTSVMIDCGSPSTARPSAVAVDDNILVCFPSSAYAVACWNDPAPATAICFRNPWSPDLVRMKLRGSFPSAPAPPTPQPLGLVLSDGDHCLIRSGGVWNDLASYPGWYGTYSCALNGAVWAADADGIDRSSPRWTVRVAPISGSGPLGTLDVITAFMVGTHTR
ncbi:hypothetical protein E3O19_09310 [Cryobacterium algoritolerans]|uniref:Ig-like domain-containing protein n=1 Tax=Cryobacterium algoritolerans TaxID=1259184 RepID=A0A4R8WS57_9MICO|nr:hypothetical protein [Cryobacterium algoritolerans]TFC15305.1 hypothetical protein E3O19_09310 [Cryobacterium algoritolerans]